MYTELIINLNYAVSINILVLQCINPMENDI